jgi:hypothetical protein
MLERDKKYFLSYKPIQYSFSLRFYSRQPYWVLEKILPIEMTYHFMSTFLAELDMDQMHSFSQCNPVINILSHCLSVFH